MTNAIIESGMPFIADNALHIEQSAAYKTLGDGVKSVELVRRKDEALIFIEAKTTFPNPNNSGDRFDLESNEIRDKFVHSLNLYAANAMGIYSDDVASTNNLSGKTCSLNLCLLFVNTR